MASETTKETAPAPEQTEVKPVDSGRPVKNISAIQGEGLDNDTLNAYRQVKSTEAFKHDEEQVQKESQGISGVSDEKRKEYYEDRREKIEKYANEKSDVVLQEMRARHPEKEAAVAALDKEFDNNDYVYGYAKGYDNDYKKLQVLDAGTEVPELITITKPTCVYRYFDGPHANGGWVTPTDYGPDIKRRKDELSLPNNGSLGEMYVLEPGTQVLSSKAAAKFGHAGGGEQYYVLNWKQALKKVHE